MINEFYYQPSAINEDDEDIDLELEGGADENIEGGDDSLEQTDEFDVPDEGEIEIDVSSLVTKQDDILTRIDTLEQSLNGDQNEKMITDFQASLADMKNSLIGTISDIKSDIASRLPTNIEKLSMRSLSSFPFNKNIAQYWYGDKKIVPSQTEDPKDEIYELTKNDVSNYTDSDIVKSF